MLPKFSMNASAKASALSRAHAEKRRLQAEEANIRAMIAEMKKQHNQLTVEALELSARDKQQRGDDDAAAAAAAAAGGGGNAAWRQESAAAAGGGGDATTAAVRTRSASGAATATKKAPMSPDAIGIDDEEAINKGELQLNADDVLRKMASGQFVCEEEESE